MSCNLVPSGRTDPVNGVHLRDKSKGSIRARLLAQSYTPSSSEPSPQSHQEEELSQSQETVDMPPGWTYPIASSTPGSTRSKSEPVKMSAANLVSGSPVKNIHMPDKSIMQIRREPTVNQQLARNSSLSSQNMEDVVPNNFDHRQHHQQQHNTINNDNGNNNNNASNKLNRLTTANGHVRYDHNDEEINSNHNHNHNHHNHSHIINHNNHNNRNNRSINNHQNLPSNCHGNHVTSGVEAAAYFAKPVFTTEEAGGGMYPPAPTAIRHSHQSTTRHHTFTNDVEATSSLAENKANRMRAGFLSSSDNSSDLELSPKQMQIQHLPHHEKQLSTASLHGGRTPPPSYGSVIVQIRQIYAALASLAGMGFFSSVLSIISMQMLFNLKAYATNQLILDIATCFSSIALTFSLVSALTSFLQLFLSCKLLKLSPGSGVRILLFLREGLYLRFVSFTGLFLSVPMLLIATICYVSMATSVIATVVTAISAAFGCIVCVLTVGHAAFAWLGGSLRLDQSEIVQPKSKHDVLIIDTKLSTLV